MIYSNKQGSDFIHLSDLNKILFSSTAMDSKRCGRDCYVVKAELDLIVGTFRTVTAYLGLLCLEQVGESTKEGGHTR